jgi:cbb3-type cytochrome oxidase subunit 3
MMLTPVLLLHGALGWWDEILCLIPTLALIALAYYVYRSDRRQKADDEKRMDDGSADLDD